MQTLAIASDHAGFALKEDIKKTLQEYDWLDVGACSEESCNYADYGHALAEAIKQEKAAFGIVICGTGIGISIAANRHAAIRAALCGNTTMARLARAHNDANVLALGARITGREVAMDCVRAFVETPFEGGRHQKRIEALNKGI